MEMTPIGYHNDGSFRFHVPCDITKGADGKVWIQGIASVEKEDLAGETVILKGMDLSYLLSRGYFNDNHGKTTDAKVGVPTEAQVTPYGLQVKGFLLDTPRAKGILELAESLNKAGSNRKLGFSVEGKTLKRDGKIIKESWIKDIAITAEPFNTDTYMDVIKSISADIAAHGYVDCCDSECSCEKPVELSYWDRMENVFSKCLNKIFGSKEAAPLEKMVAGYQSPAESGGSALRSESLETDMKNLDIPQQLNSEQAVTVLMGRGYPEAAARRMAGLIFDSSFQKFLTNL